MRVLIVGNGFAGSQLAYFLSEGKVEVTLLSYSDFHSKCSTSISAGIMLPFTGRRKVLTFNADQILPFAINHYAQLEFSSGISILNDLEVVQLIRDAGEYNDWIAKSSDTNSSGFIGTIDMGKYIDGLNNFFGFVQLRFSKSVKSLELLEAVKQQSSHVHYEEGRFNFENLQTIDSGLIYNQEYYDRLIFCEGYRVIQNPFWKNLPFMPVKGEMIEIYAPKLSLDSILNGSIYMIPKGNSRFLVGATYNWKDIDENPSESGLIQLKTEIERVLSCDFSIVSHYAGVRPAIQDRRPVIGFHPTHSCIGVFNGLGTKGAMLAPYYAKQLSDHIVNGKAIDFDVSVDRFKEIWVQC
jgi:glycine/D-amino acid oxidase-like deaminating enzyme